MYMKLIYAVCFNKFGPQKSMVADTFYLELKKKLNPSDFSGDDLSECLENTRKQPLQRIYDWVNAEGCPNVLLLIWQQVPGKALSPQPLQGNIRNADNLVATCSSSVERAIQEMSYKLSRILWLCTTNL